MKTKRLISYLLLVFFFVSCSNPKSLKEELQQSLDQIITDAQVPGATFSVVLPDNKVISLASGLADKEKNIRMKSNDRMFSGSIGKQYCAALILKLEEEGRVRISHPLKLYFGDEEWFSRIPNSEDLTLEMLLNHTSGIPRYVLDTAIWKIQKANPEKTWTGVERLSYIFDAEPLHEAGKGWGYSDTNYILLGMIIEKVTGREYYSLIDEYFVKPLGLVNTIPAKQRKTKGLVAGYTEASHIFLTPQKVVENGIHYYNPQFEWTGGGFINTTTDLAKWEKLLYEGAFLSKESVEKMIRPTSQKPVSENEAGYGLATMIMEIHGQKIYGHSGTFPGYRSIVHYIPELGISLAMQFNKDTPAKGHNIYKLMERMDEVLIEYYEIGELEESGK